MSDESGMDEVPRIEASAERIALAEKNIFGTLAQLRGVHPFTPDDESLIQEGFVDVNGASFESHDGEPGTVPFNTDGTKVDYEVLDKVGRFNWQQVEDRNVLGFVDTAGHFRVGLVNDHHTSLLLARGYTHDAELAVPFTHGQMPRRESLANALARTGVLPHANE